MLTGTCPACFRQSDVPDHLIPTDETYGHVVLCTRCAHAFYVVLDADGPATQNIPFLDSQDMVNDPLFEKMRADQERILRERNLWG